MKTKYSYGTNSEEMMSLKFRGIAFLMQAVLLASIVSLVGCSKSSEQQAKSESASQPGQASATTYASPDEASNALVAAVRAHSRDAVMAILGPDSKEVISSGDEVQDKNMADLFATGYDVMHRWRTMTDGSQTLLLGPDNFPFAIPLKKNASGRWYFDTAAGKDEVLNRRIGRNELATIDSCEAVVDAQNEYFSQPRNGSTVKQYAAKFLSDPGKQNGLYWKAAEGQPESPLGPFAADASAEGYAAKADGPTPFHGYYFRVLTGQSSKAPGGAKNYVVDGKMVGGFAIVAYPAKYGDSGIMTFIINQDDLLLQRDLGPNTKDIATAMTEYDPSSDWTPVQ